MAAAVYVRSLPAGRSWTEPGWRSYILCTPRLPLAPVSGRQEDHAGCQLFEAGMRWRFSKESMTVLEVETAGRSAWAVSESESPWARTSGNLPVRDSISREDTRNG